MGTPATALAVHRGAGQPALVVAHRGAWGDAPQNSLAAFEQAIADGADGVELDVRRTADDRLVVVHDPRLGMRRVSELTHAEVRARMAGGQAPELGEVLAALAGRILVDIELKEDGYVAETMAVVTAALPDGGYVVTSFLDGVLPRVRAAAPRAATGLLLGSRRKLRRLEQRLTDSGADFIAPHVSLLRGGLLDWAASRRLAVWTWTVNDERARHALLFDPRVAAIITDRAASAAAQAAGAEPAPS